MSNPWTEAWEEAAASAPPSVTVYVTLELWHTSFADPVRVVTNVIDDQTFTLEAGAPRNAGEAVLFTAVPCRADWPEVGERTAPQVRVTIDNIGRELVPILENALSYRGDLSVLYREYRSDDTSEPCYGPVEFVIKRVSVTGSSVVGMAQIVDLANRKFPRKAYTLTEFPSLLP